MIINENARLAVHRGFERFFTDRCLWPSPDEFNDEADDALAAYSGQRTGLPTDLAGNDKAAAPGTWQGVNWGAHCDYFGAHKVLVTLFGEGAQATARQWMFFPPAVSTVGAAGL